MSSFNLSVANYTKHDNFFVSISKNEVCSISELSFEEKNDFVKINLKESKNFLTYAGKPALPFIVKDFVIPKNSIIKSVNCKLTSFSEEKLDYKIIPASEPILKLKTDEMMAGKYNCNMKIYSSHDFYPYKWYDYSMTHGIDGIRLSIRIYPVRYSPASNLIRVASDFEIEIVYDSLLEKESFSEEYDMVVIAPNIFSFALKPLINHKNSIDVNCFLKSTQKIYDEYPGRDNAEKIKYFIQDAIDSFNISYVLLVGGMKGLKQEWYVPVRETNVDDGWESGYISDLYFADIYRLNQTSFEKEFDDWDSNGNNVFAEWDLNSIHPEDVIDCDPDVHIGRLACRSISEVKNVVSKIIDYETKNKDFVHSKNFICVGGDTVPPYDDPENICEGEFMCDIASGDMKNVGYDTVKLYVSNGSLKRPLDVIKTLNLGAGFAYFNGHGNPFSWSTHPPESNDYSWIDGLNNNQMNLLFNKKRLPVVVVVGCHNSQFNVTPVKFFEGIKNKGLGYFSLNSSSLGGFWNVDWIRECWGWKLVSIKHGGAIATIGNTGLGYGLQGSEIAYSDWISLQFFDAIANQNKTTLGEAHSASISDYVACFDINGEDNKIDRKSVDDLVLLGDPSIKII